MGRDLQGKRINPKKHQEHRRKNRVFYTDVHLTSDQAHHPNRLMLTQSALRHLEAV